MSTETKSNIISFTKTMFSSTVNYPYHLTLPSEFCDQNLPRHNANIILIGETENEYNVNYLVNGHRIIRVAGWGSFVVGHELIKGDKLSFRLIGECKFKVHITRARRSVENEFQNNKPVDVVKSEGISEENICTGNTVTQAKRPASLVIDNQVYVRKKYRSTETKSAYDTDSAAPSGIENPESALSLNGFEEFKICANGEMLDSEIPVDIRVKYYELCCVEKRFLHDSIAKDLTSKLVVSMIQDIVRISESTKATGISTSIRHLESMDNTLKSFEDLGMAVGSLRAKIGKLVKILKEHHSIAESTIVRLEAIECERKAFMEKKAKIDEMIASALAQGKKIGCLEKNIDDSKEKMDELSLMLKEVAR